MIERDEQVLVINWAKQNEGMHPQLKLLNGSLNGVVLPIGLAKKAKASGMKAGYPDLSLPVQMNGYGGLFIELKTDIGVVQPNQKIWLYELNLYGNLAVVCRGHIAAIQTIKDYLKILGE